jgi:hypothetical protein
VQEGVYKAEATSSVNEEAKLQLTSHEGIKGVLEKDGKENYLGS